MPLPPDAWQHVVTFLSIVDLAAFGAVNHEFNEWASHDRLWKDHCDRQWEGKQGEMVLSLRDDTNDDDDAPSAAVTAVNSEPSRSWWSSLRHTALLGYGRPCEGMRRPRPPSSAGLSSLRSWKQKYCVVANDSLRQTITTEEVWYYSWKLWYGDDSNLGLRRFGKDGTYHSPYFGICEWALSPNGDTMLLMGLKLAVERDPRTWGWILGKGTSTVYVSVDPAMGSS